MIGLIGAMEQEVAHLRGCLTGAVTRTVCGIDYTQGSLAGQDVVLARAGVGKVNAATTCQTMILLFRPDAVVNTGVAGAIGDSLTVGDAVVADALVEHDMDTTPVGDPPGLVTVGGRNLIEIPTDPVVTARLSAAARAEGVHAVTGVIASGDQFVATPQQKARIRDLFGALACEMEGAAIAHVCAAAGVPCGVLRVLSDSADGSASVDYPTFVAGAAQKSAAVILRFLRGASPA